MTGSLAYDPQRLATLASITQAAADELAAVSGDAPNLGDAVDIAHGIAASLDEALLASLTAVLSSTAMSEWNGVSIFLTVDQLIDALTEQTAGPMAPFVLDNGSEFSLDAAITASEPAQWFHEINPACVIFAGGSYHGGGYVTDHRGVRYPIVVPRVETDGGDVYTADRHAPASGEPSVATLGGTDPGWEIVGCATGTERFQAEPSVAQTAWGFLAGTTGLVGPLPPNSGLAYIAVSAGGPPHLVDEPPVPAPFVAPPLAGVPDPRDSSPAAAVESSVALGVTVAQGGAMAAAMDNQTQRAYQVIFEENDDGRRRARIQTYTLGYDDEGDVVIVPEHVFVNGDGELISETINYGSPYETDGVFLSASTDDVADFAFSGDEPISYPVPAAVFP